MSNKAVGILMLLVATFWFGFIMLNGCDECQQKADGPYPLKVIKKDGLNEKLIFIRHHESGLCFAFVWLGHANGGPAISEVDSKFCD